MEARTLELVFPEHTNPMGAAFGGFVLGLMDKVAPTPPPAGPESPW